MNTEDLEFVVETLIWADKFMKARDAMNGAVHTSDVRLSRLTIDVDAALRLVWAELPESSSVRHSFDVAGVTA